MNPSNSTARFAGFMYLVIAVVAIFAHFVVRDSLIVAGDATATANNIMQSEGLYRLGFVADMIAFLCEVMLSVALYVLLKPVNSTLALLMTSARLVMTAILGINLLNHFMPILLLSGANYLNVFTSDQLHALALFFVNAHAVGYAIGLFFFSLHTCLLGYLVFKSTYFPKILGILLIIASLSYLADSTTTFLFPQYQATVAEWMVFPAMIGELSFVFWLLIKGVKRQAK